MYETLRAETEEAVAPDESSYPVITSTQAPKLPCSQAYIWEGLRIYSPLLGLKSDLVLHREHTTKSNFSPMARSLVAAAQPSANGRIPLVETRTFFDLTGS